MTKIIVYEDEDGPEITEFKTDPKGKPERVIKKKDWQGDPKKLRAEAEKPDKPE